jgi:molybdopterin-binding protein
VSTASGDWEHSSLKAAVLRLAIFSVSIRIFGFVRIAGNRLTMTLRPNQPMLCIQRTFSKSVRAKLITALISFPMCCHSRIVLPTSRRIVVESLSMSMDTSMRNRIPGTIKAIVSDNVVSELMLRTASGDVTAIITTGSVKRMNLKLGDNVFAIIKATEVSIEK